MGTGGASALPQNINIMDRDYIVVEAKTADELTAKVRELIRQKYRPCGGVSVAVSGKSMKLFQAVER